jgi:hypothetical protein
MQIGVNAVDATPDINVSTIWALVEYVDGVAAAGGPKFLFRQGRTIIKGPRVILR